MVWPSAVDWKTKGSPPVLLGRGVEVGPGAVVLPAAGVLFIEALSASVGVSVGALSFESPLQASSSAGNRNRKTVRFLTGRLAWRETRAGTAA
jgi:hypothetical protein